MQSAAKARYIIGLTAGDQISANLNMTSPHEMLAGVTKNHTHGPYIILLGQIRIITFYIYAF